ncbi:MAG: amino acid ABC transporter permease [Nisaea sp.]|jgi:polar amino acid transport system permease protein|uniref:amino acid ABC transporter permease n=1 Tax=Nisaea sp. TaxID=2024842 RepID=UPI001B134314|nr:amino acid ABC transporter permease [Nisaea sp.]MBO6562552.1 amino acid ABC transporter permease [Nisaea sp.]
MDELIYNFFNIDIMKEVFPLMLRGAGMTLLLCLAVIPLGLLGGLLVALATRTKYRMLRYAVIALIDLFRAVPPLVLLIFVYAGLPFAGVEISPFTAVCVAFLLNNSAYFAEIYRAGIDSIGAGQFEAARSTGLSGIQTMRYVILPQATRNVLPDLLSNIIEIVKLTSIASVVSFQELLYSADMARSVTYNASPIVMAAAAYLIMLWPVVRLLSRLEHRVGH